VEKLKSNSKNINIDFESAKWALSSTIERLLNSYFREIGIFNLSTVTINTESLAPIIREQISANGEFLRVELPKTNTAIIGTIAYNSPFGHHHYGSDFWIESIENQTVKKIEAIKDITKPILYELSTHIDKEMDFEKESGSFLSNIENSYQKTKIYIEHNAKFNHFLLGMDSEEKFAAVEQSLIFGHPFHPTPKSSQGFSEKDLMRYAPEMKASFPLYYFAVDPILIEEELDKTDEVLFSSQVLSIAQQKLVETQKHYSLLPCHPWQAQHVKKWPEIQELIESGKLVDLGLLENNVYPTSSVRTVWDPTHHYFFKLPLNVRITNFIRVNPPEQLKRTVDASRLLKKLSQELPFNNFTIISEEGYRTLKIKDLPENKQVELTESFAVIFRENPVVQPFKLGTPLVVAGLLEKPVEDVEPYLIQAIRLVANEENRELTSELIEKWLNCYLDISIRPLLSMFLEYGVSLEAHVQNSMVTLKNGWPIHFYVRDLEGVSISQERATQHCYFDGLVNEFSSALYPDAEAWHRFKYYVLVNHFGHLIHTLAFYGKIDERELWKILRNYLESSNLFVNKESIYYLKDLLEEDFLPAKANLISCFQKRGERPVYVAVPNLMKKL